MINSYHIRYDIITDKSYLLFNKHKFEVELEFTEINNHLILGKLVDSYEEYYQDWLLELNKGENI